MSKKYYELDPYFSNHRTPLDPSFEISVVNVFGTQFKHLKQLDEIMGNWQLEAFKFSLYISAPVLAFWYFHQYENVRENLDKYYQATTDERTMKNHKMIIEAQQKMREIRDKRFEKELENMQSAKSKE